jgi:phospholipid-binding lipoprotein MlaA
MSQPHYGVMTMPMSRWPTRLASTGRTVGVLLAIVAGGLAGCATPPPDDDPESIAEFEQLNDPFEPTNRMIFAFDERVDDYLLRPLAQGYRDVTPAYGRDRVADFLSNLKTPIYLMNDLLQGNFTLAGETLERCALNTSFGVLGLMDVAGPLGIPAHSSDFGQTLGVWGVAEGPYLVLPLFGPSNPRDAIGLGADSIADPLDYYLADDNQHWALWTRRGMTALSEREANLDTLDDVKRMALDYYSTMRSLYRQHREAEINRAVDGRQGMVPPLGMSALAPDTQSGTP